MGASSDTSQDRSSKVRTLTQRLDRYEIQISSFDTTQSFLILSSSRMNGILHQALSSNAHSAVTRSPRPARLAASPHRQLWSASQEVVIAAKQFSKSEFRGAPGLVRRAAFTCACSSLESSVRNPSQQRRRMRNCPPIRHCAVLELRQGHLRAPSPL